MTQPLILLYTKPTGNFSPGKDNGLNSFLAKRFENFSKTLLEANRFNSLYKFEVNQGVNLNSKKREHNFAQVKLIGKDGTLIERVNITYALNSYEAKLNILPSSDESGYSFDRGGEKAKIRTEALELITKTLFEIFDGKVSITSSTDSLNIPGSSKEAIRYGVPFSTHTILASGLYHRDLPYIAGSQIHYAEENDTGAIFKVTDHCFSGSGFTSRGIAALGNFKQLINI